jgi:hypothetical protein
MRRDVSRPRRPAHLAEPVILSEAPAPHPSRRAEARAPTEESGRWAHGTVGREASREEPPLDGLHRCRTRFFGRRHGSAREDGIARRRPQNDSDPPPSRVRRVTPCRTCHSERGARPAPSPARGSPCADRRIWSMGARHRRAESPSREPCPTHPAEPVILSEAPAPHCPRRAEAHAPTEESGRYRRTAPSDGKPLARAPARRAAPLPNPILRPAPRVCAEDGMAGADLKNDSDPRPSPAPPDGRTAPSGGKSLARAPARQAGAVHASEALFAERVSARQGLSQSQRRL